ncbi:Zinc finger and SCAN domain-containing protein 18, partial [Ophiophagus hannah]
MEARWSPLQAGSGCSKAERWRFRSCASREAEGPRALCSRLHRLCREWLRPERSSKAEMLDLVVLEQLLALLRGLDSPTDSLNGAESCAQAVALAEGCLLGPGAAPEPEKGRQVKKVKRGTLKYFAAFVQEPFARDISAELQERDQSNPRQLHFRRIQLGPSCQASDKLENDNEKQMRLMSMETANLQAEEVISGHQQNANPQEKSYSEDQG